MESWARRFLPVIIAMLAIIGVGIAIFPLVNRTADPIAELTARTFQRVQLAESRSLRTERELQVLVKVMRRQELEVRRLRIQLSQLSKPSGESRLTSRLSSIEETLRQFESSQESLERDQQSLEDVLMNSPSKSLQLPLLARDIENDRRVNEAAFLALRREAEGQDELIRWVFGTFIFAIITMLLAVILPLRKGAKDSVSQ
jgi:hypothetical protein